MTTHYTGHLVQTRTAATAWSAVWFAVLLPSLLQRLDWSRPMMENATLVVLTLMPSLVAFRILRFLSKREREQATPTPDMEFIFGLAITVPMVFSAALLTALNHWR